jgi:hypothetical protein
MGNDITKRRKIMWYVWDKTTDINGFSAADMLARNKHLQNEGTIYVKEVNGRAIEIEGKSILASVYGIDINLSDEEFLAAYEAIVNPPVNPDEITDSEALAIITGEAE